MLFAAAVLAAAVGCTSTRSNSDFIPDEMLARDAVEAVLSEWRDGKSPGRIERLKTPIEVVDTQRQAGQELADYEVLGPVAGAAPRCFAVRVELKNPNAEQRIRFVVVGISPLWVFRQEDYETISHWDMVMPPKPVDAEAAPDAPAPTQAVEPASE